MSSAVNDPNMAAREDGTQGAPIMEQKPQHPEATAHVAAAKRGHGLKRLLAVVGGTIFVASIAGIITLGVKMNQSENKYHALSEKYNSALSEAHAMTRMIPRHDTAMAAMEGDMSSTVGVFGIEVNTVMVTVDLSTTVTVAQSTSTTETAETRPDMATFTTSEAEDVVTLSNTDNWDMPTASPWIDPAETFTEDWETTTSTTLTTSAPAETASEHSVPLGPYTFQPSDSAAADTTSTATTSGATTIHLTRSATVVVHESSSSSSSSSSSFMARETSSAAALSGSACACTPHMHTETVWVPYTETVDNTYTQTVYVSLAAAHTTVEEGTVAVTETVPTETVSVAQPYPFSGETTTTVTVDVSETSSVMPVSHDLPPLATATWHSASSSSSSSHTLSSTTTPTSTATTMTTTRLYTFTVGPDSHVTTVTLPPLGTATHHSGNNSAAPSTTAASARNTAPYFLNGTSTARTSTVTVVRGSGTAGVLAVAGSTPAFGSPISLAAPGPKTSIVASGAGAGPKIQGRGNSGSGSGTPVMGCVVMLIALALVVV